MKVSTAAHILAALAVILFYAAGYPPLLGQSAIAFGCTALILTQLERMERKL